MKKTLIKNADWILTMDARRSRLRNADILITGNRISSIGKNLAEMESADTVIDASGMVVLPGFVNTHHHCFQSLVRNIHVANGLKLEPWLTTVYKIFLEITPEAVEAGAQIGLGYLLKTGCTTSMDHHYTHPTGTSRLIDSQIEAARKLGIRCHPTRGSISIGQSGGSAHVPDALAESTDEILIDSERLINSYHDPARFSMCRVALAPCWPEFETEEILRGTLELVKKHSVQGHTHLAESQGEIEYCLEHYGCRPVEFVRRRGWLGKEFYFAHAVELDDHDVEVIAETQSGVAHCPISNMFLNSAVCRVPDLIEKGASIGIGVDGAASSNSSNMMAEIRTSYLVHQLTRGHRGPSAEDILYIATAGGSRSSEPG